MNCVCSITSEQNYSHFLCIPVDFVVEIEGNVIFYPWSEFIWTDIQFHPNVRTQKMCFLKKKTVTIVSFSALNFLAASCQSASRKSERIKQWELKCVMDEASPALWWQHGRPPSGCRPNSARLLGKQEEKWNNWF